MKCDTMLMGDTMKYFDEKYNHYFDCKQFNSGVDSHFLQISEVGHYKSVEHSIQRNSKHPGDVLLFYVHSGQGIVSIGSEYRAMIPGDLVIFSTDQPFFISNHNWEVYYAFVNGVDVRSFISLICYKKNMFDYRYKASSVSFFHQVLQSKDDDLLRHFLINKLFSELYITGKNEVDKNIDVIRDALLFIENHYMDDISLKDISQYVGYSEFYFSRLFKKMLSESPYAFLIKRRLLQAKLLLVTSNDSIEEICHKSGFFSENNFYSLFQREVKMTPIKYRDSHRR